MSSSLNVYVGPYFQTSETARTVSRVKPAHCSRSALHPVSNSASFCSTCGAAVTPRTSESVEVRGFVMPHEHGDLSNYEDRMVASTQNDGRWMPNQRGFGTNYSEHSPLISEDIDANSIAASIARMTIAYGDFIEHMKQLHGIEAVAKFGAIPYEF